jgi:S1-C subfamily serine protease
MRPLFILALFLTIISCRPQESPKIVDDPPAVPDEAVSAAPRLETVAAPSDVTRSVARINSTQQSWNTWQPWEKNSPRKRRALAAIVGPQRVLTTSELVSDATYLELESTDGTRFARAKVIAVDYEANLALLGPTSEKEGNAFFEETIPFKVTPSPKIGGALSILQVEDNGLALETTGILQSVEVSANLLPGHSFLTYLVKASMQSAASSYSLPVLCNGMLAGVLTSYDSKDQLCDVTSTDIVARFLDEAASGTYKGFPSLGVSIARTEDSSFRQWLKLTDDQGGLFIETVRKGGAADLAGVKNGDVLLAVDGQAIDRRGYYEHPHYGSLSWGHLIRGSRSIGDSVTLSLLRDGKPLDFKATLSRKEEGNLLVPDHIFDRPPNYLLKGGLVFQELSLPILEAFGDEWRSSAPLNLLDTYQNPEKYQETMDRVVFLSGVIPTPATVGYERLRNLIVTKVNGKEIKNIKNLINAFENGAAGLHSIEFAEENLTVYLDEAVTTNVDSQLLQHGINRLSHAE